MTDNTTRNLRERTIRLNALTRLNRLSETGVHGVADRLRTIGDGGSDVATEWAKAGFVSRDGTDAFDDQQCVGVRVKLSNSPAGYVLVVFDIPSADHAATLLLSNAVNRLDEASNDLAHSAVTELGGMMAYGFVDGVADVIDREIDVRTPKLLGGTEQELISRTIRLNEQLGLYIASRFSLPDHDIVASVFLFPESEAMIRLVENLDEMTAP